MAIPYFSTCLVCNATYNKVVARCEKCADVDSIISEPYEIKER